MNTQGAENPAAAIGEEGAGPLRTAATNNRATMAERHGAAACPVAPPLESVIGFEALWTSAFRCARGVGWKYSTQLFVVHAAEKVLALSDALESGRYREGRTHVVNITYPKKRTAIAISFTDRVFQRSLNDGILYPFMTRPLIYANFACQRGKGTDAARDYYFASLRRAYLRYGLDDLVIVTVDFRNYYGSMRHEIVNAQFRARVPRPYAEWAIRTLEGQYDGEVGYNPGSQMVQIAGICYLDPVDHYMKERLGVRFYVHYMDDIHAMMPRREAAAFLDAMRRESAKLGLTMHPDKTRVVDARDGAVFLGFWYRLTPTGRVLVSRDPKRVKEIRRRLVRLAHKEARGGVAPGTLGQSWRCVRACIDKGNTDGLKRRMDGFYDKLKGGMKNGRQEIAA